MAAFNVNDHHGMHDSCTCFPLHQLSLSMQRAHFVMSYQLAGLQIAMHRASDQNATRTYALPTVYWSLPLRSCN